MRIYGLRSDGAYHIGIGAGMSIILRGDLCSAPMDSQVVDRKHGPWREVDVASEKRRELERQMAKARVSRTVVSLADVVGPPAEVPAAEAGTAPDLTPVLTAGSGASVVVGDFASEQEAAASAESTAQLLASQHGFSEAGREAADESAGIRMAIMLTHQDGRAIDVVVGQDPSDGSFPVVAMEAGGAAPEADPAEPEMASEMMAE